MVMSYHKRKSFWRKLSEVLIGLLSAAGFGVLWLGIVSSVVPVLVFGALLMAPGIAWSVVELVKIARYRY